ncbi:MAG TPA: GntR family transcriptional regulator [Terriglobales bacterium]|jgi:DNA-binding transcriptional regulator YhcF (GntR family)|nr:GntR family transcriptional regulator [Terriglobales bacterium]
MRFWISHASEVAIREQLTTQIVLAILSEDLKAGTRLPSTRELARRFRIHANTVSAAYRDLKKAGWLELRQGSGVYIREHSEQKPLLPELGLDRLIASVFRLARQSGIPLSVVRRRLRHWLDLQPPDHFLLIEPDAELANIVVAEMQQVVTFPVMALGLSACNSPELLQSAIPVAMPSKVATVRGKLPEGVECIGLRVRSVTDSLVPWMPARRDALVAVVSGWPDFLKRARTMLVAAGFDSDGLLVRDVREGGWEKGLGQAAAVICDSLTVTRVPKQCRAILFPLLAQASLAELRRYQDFITQPFT